MMTILTYKETSIYSQEVNMDTPHEAMEILRPFFPNQFGMAKGILSKEMPDAPEWVVETITYMLFESLEMERVAKEFKQHIIGRHEDRELPPEDIKPPVINFDISIFY